MANSEYLLKVEHLKQYFPIKTGLFGTTPLKAVDDVSFAIRPGETLGLVGESGCGKTTVGRTLLQLYNPTAGRITFDGEVLFDSGEQYDENGRLKVDANGKPVLGPKVKKNMLPYRKQMQMVFQDPYSSLNPRMTVEDIIGEPLDIHKLCANKKERRERVMELMETVGLNAEHAMRYPHEFSGGQRQRIGITHTLAVNPKFIVCDEPVSALDVSIQAQVVNMFEDLQEKLGVAYLFIAHDLLVVHHISDRIAVMYLGHLMEMATADELNAVRTEPEHAVRRFTHGGKCLGQNVVKRFAVGKAPLELRRFRLKLGVAQRLILVLQRLDSLNDRVDALEFALRVGTEHFGEKSHNCKFLSWEHMNTNTV